MIPICFDIHISNHILTNKKNFFKLSFIVVKIKKTIFTLSGPPELCLIVIFPSRPPTVAKPFRNPNRPILPVGVWEWLENGWWTFGGRLVDEYWIMVDG